MGAIKIEVDGLSFVFPSDWKVCKYDEGEFYRKKFIKIKDGVKAVDVVAISPERILYLMEVKDYRFHRRTNPSGIHEILIDKILYTLASLFALAASDERGYEKDLADQAIKCKSIRVVFHLEQATSGSRLSPRKYKLEDLQQKIRQKIRPIDKRALVIEQKSMSRVEWKCNFLPKE